jgi:DNA-binding LacI/PurR family transcriptional regulator
MFDGLIVQTVSIHDSLIPRLLRRQIPVVVSGRPAQDIRATYVDADNENGAYLAVRHLLKLGRRKISVITGEMTSTSSIDRLDGYKRALREFDIPYDKRLVHESDYLMEGGYQATSVLIKQNPDAIFAFSDTMARGALRALADRGISVPEQISVIGFDDLPPATNERPMLTTVRQPVRQAGQKLVELLLNKISNGSHSTEQVIFDTELIVRETCGGAA